VSYTYDGADRLLTMTYPSGRIITYVRNANGKITGVTSKANATATAITLASKVAWQPNVAGAVSGETVFGQGNIATAVQNQALPNDGGLGTVDLLQSLTYGNGLVLWKNFNTDNELYQLIVEQSPSTLAGIRINRFYNRADETNITGIADGLTPANDETYSYTDAGRLAGATSSTTASYGARSWTYDNNGNRLTETANGTVNIYAYPANNNRLSTVKQGTTTTRAFVYDAAGNATRDTRGTTAYNYAVNNAGRIKTLTIGTTLRTTYTYDGMQKLRVKAQTTPVSTTHYIWDAFGHIIAEHASAGGVQKEYIWLGDTPLAVFEGANLFYVHPDNLDRPVMMTNNNIGQTIAWQARYDPFGNPVTVTSAITNNQRLPGQWFQIEDGLAYNWHRTYDPTIGRYTQADPLGFVDGPSVYGYAGQSPVMRVDPTGLDTPAMGPYGPCYSGLCGSAQKLLKSPNYSYFSCNSEARGRLRSLICGAPSLKCNKFVWDAANGARAPAGRMPDGRIPSASEWGNPSTPIPNFSPIPSGENPQPGDIVGDGHHVGVFSPLESGAPGTTSAASFFRGNGPVHNDWGFRDGQNVTIWRRN
jgi:RHS repeat-associated protein